MRRPASLPASSASLDELRVADVEEGGVVVVDHLAACRSRSRERAELGIADRSQACLGERARGSRGREIAGLRAEPQQDPVGRVERDLDADAVGLRALGLLDAVAGDVGGVVEPRQERAIVRGEDLGLSHALLRAHEGQGLPDRAGEQGGGRHYFRRTGVETVG